MLKTKCPICDSLDDYVIVYKSNFSNFDFNSKVFSARRLPDTIHYQIVRCKNDNLMRSNPICDRTIADSLYKISSLNYVDQIENLTSSYLNIIDEVLSVIPKDAMILEIGCANGFMLRALLDKGYSNLHGIEPSSDAVSKADNNVRNKIVVDFLRDGIYKNKSFDFIFFFQVFGHIYDPANFLNICYDLLTPGGFILALDHDVESLSAKIFREKSPIIDIQHIYLYSKETICKLFFKYGFNIIRAYSTPSVFSLKYLISLIPLLPKKIKLRIFNSKNKIINLLLGLRIKTHLGNLCILARRPINNEHLSN